MIAAMLAAVATPAKAQDVAAAEAFFNRGVEALKAGRYNQACPLIAESQRLDPQAGTLFTLAQCEDKRGRSATALTHYREYLARYSTMNHEQKVAHQKRSGIAVARAKALEPGVPLLTIQLADNQTPGAVVKKDGDLLPSTALGIPLPTDPGEHFLSVQTPGERARELRVVLVDGERRTVTLEAMPAPPVPSAGVPTVPSAPAPPPSSDVPPSPASPAGARLTEPDVSSKRIGAYVVGGVGATALLIGGILGGVTLAQKAVVDEECGVDGVKSRCRNQAAADAGNSANTTALASTIGIVTGAAGVGTALLLWLTDKSPVTPNGRTSHAAVLIAGPTGAVVGWRGSW